MAKQFAVVILIVASFALTAQAAGGIKGQASVNIGAIKGPRQLRPVLPAPPAPVAIAPPAPVVIAPQPLPAPAKGPARLAPLFRPVPVAPVIAAPAPIPVAPVPAPAPAPLVIEQQQQQLVQVQEQEQEPEQEPAAQQQQQQLVEPSEVDPNQAAQDSVPAIAAPAPIVAPLSAEEANPRPEPYNFEYGYQSGDSASAGTFQRAEQQDANGRVVGHYKITGDDGRERTVHYTADENGFRATVTTNEMGLSEAAPADTQVAWSAPSPGQLRSAEAASQRALLAQNIAPLPLQQRLISSASSASPIKVSLVRQEPVAASEISQLQEPFEQIRLTELGTRARKSRHV